MLMFVQVTSTVKLPKQRDAEPVSASFTLPLLNPTTSTTLMLSTVDKASTGNVEVCSLLFEMCSCFTTLAVVSSLNLPADI